MTRRLDTDHQKMLCYCLGVRYGRVIEAIRNEECRSVLQVTRACKAGGGCRSCHPEIEDLIEEIRSERPSGLRARLRRLLGRG